ncbi:hypothetical protein KKE92_06550 [Candidatus Micrarchaeota archaeon]|nr:hypothetical protein [Candidatus Micrarchaeota archaeon]
MGCKTRGGSVKHFHILELDGTKPETINSCFYIQGRNLRSIFDEIVNEICKREKINQYELSREITVQIGTEKSTILKYFREHTFFPVFLLNVMLSKLPQYRKDFFCSKIQMGVEFFKFGISKNWVKFPKRLTKELAWLIGAIAADGWISRDKQGKERLGIVDQNACVLRMGQEKFEKIFGIKFSLKKSKKENCWLLIVDCKAISRFFTMFLGFSYGYKAKNIHEPEILKKSHYRFEFARGVMSFDGSVELDSTVTIGLKSKKFINDLSEIFYENGFEFKYSCSKSGFFFLKSQYLSQCTDSKKWISIFGDKTTKGNRLNFLINGIGYPPNSEENALASLEYFTRKRATSKVSITSIFHFAKKKKKITKHQLMTELGISHATLWKYLLLLRRANIIKNEENKGRGKTNHYLYISNIGDWCVPFMVS